MSAMPASVLLQTKFLIPRAGSDRLSRPHLIQQLSDNLHKRLTLISAPPGYGKTTLLAQFAAGTTLPCAWYQLDTADGDPAVFLAYLIESLCRSRPAVAGPERPYGAAAQSLLDSAGGLSVRPEQVLTVLINELVESVADKWLLVLEDYHLITNPVLHNLVDYLIANAPPGFHLLISTRSDPPLALARLRVRGELVEFRQSDLRFAAGEVSEWLDRALPGLSSESIRLLSEKTEGWAAAVQIALSSLAGKDVEAAGRFIEELSGSHRFVFDYLAEEVFRQQPPEIQQFLLYTAVLSQMDAQVCAALPGVSHSQATLDYLEQHNLFVVSLDEKRHWYRYHHLFRDFLLAKLRREQPQQARTLERAAGAYYEQSFRTIAELEASFLHYRQGEEMTAAARVLAAFAPEYIERGRVEVLQRYLGTFPVEAARAHPELLLYHGDVLRRVGQAGAAVNRYEDARVAFATRGDAAGICRSLTELAEAARLQGDYRRAQKLAAEALTYARTTDHAGRARALMALAKSEGFLTGMDRGRNLAEQAVTEARLAGEARSARARAALLRSLGQICWWHGDPQATVRYCREALQAAPDELSPLAAQALITMATPHLYWRELDTALDCAERGVEIVQQLQLNELLPAAYATLGNVLTRRGESARAESCLRQAMAFSQHLGLATYAHVMAAGFLAYNLCGQGRFDEARQLAETALWSYGGSPDTYELCVCRSVLADIALSEGQWEQAEQLFEHLLEIDRRRQFRIPLAMVYFGLAYICLANGREEQGLEHATQALDIIEVTGAVQLLLDQGERAVVVCRALAAAGKQSPLVKEVLEALPAAVEKGAVPVADRTAVRVHCLGLFRVWVGEHEITQERWVSTKARDLLAYFVTFRREHIPLDVAFDALWPEAAGQSKTAFHTALYRLRQALRLSGQRAKFILVEGGEYWLDASRFQIDVEEFDTALAKARVSDGDEARHWYEQVVNSYQGDYLENMPYYDWAMPERRRLHEAYLDALEALAYHHAAAGDFESALAYTLRILQCDALREESHCQALRYYARLGDRTGLIRHYRQLRQTLGDQLGVAPLATTDQLYQALLEQVAA
jgi:LuxR family transcriptional regulator, maltose regulon positive regulatory protein